MEKLGPHGCGWQSSVLQLLLSLLEAEGVLLQPVEHVGHVKLGVFQDI